MSLSRSQLCLQFIPCVSGVFLSHVSLVLPCQSFSLFLPVWDCLSRDRCAGARAEPHQLHPKVSALPYPLCQIVAPAQSLCISGLSSLCFLVAYYQLLILFLHPLLSCLFCSGPCLQPFILSAPILCLGPPLHSATTRFPLWTLFSAQPWFSPCSAQPDVPHRPTLPVTSSAQLFPGSHPRNKVSSLLITPVCSPPCISYLGPPTYTITVIMSYAYYFHYFDVYFFIPDFT